MSEFELGGKQKLNGGHVVREPGLAYRDQVFTRGDLNNILLQVERLKEIQEMGGGIAWDEGVVDKSGDPADYIDSEIEALKHLLG